MAKLRTAAVRVFGADYSEKRVCGNARFAFDFYFPDEETVVEVALSLRNPSSEYERDIFKCLLAIEGGCSIRQLVFITKPGGHFRIFQRPGATAIRTYADKKYRLKIDVREICDAPVDVKTAVQHVALYQTSKSGKRSISF